MTCQQCLDLLELYALGALESSEGNEVSEHLATGCTLCREALRQALDFNMLVARNVPLVNPPARLRQRIRDSVPSQAAPRRLWLTWALAAAALLAIIIGLTSQIQHERAAAVIARTQTADRDRLSSALQILGAPGTTAVAFTDPKSPELHGAIYIHQKLGLALIIDHLPTAPAGWKYESWIVPKTGAPQPVEPFHPDSGGRAVSVVPGPVEVAHLDGIAVSMEPLQSHPVKPTTLVFEARL